MEVASKKDCTGGRKQDDFPLELFDELCTWLETEQFVYNGVDTSKDDFHG